ncbi:MAG TPA: sigma-70 family RNA polymerase sigma factor [Bryobacteraceae bacterium]|nr:sigma-70 family RNA polymerase sigma factor [Bryobacteraceae bacterium]
MQGNNVTAVEREQIMEPELGRSEQPNSQAAADDYGDWERLVDKVKANDPAGLEELYKVFGRGIRFYLYRQLGPQDLEDRVHDAFLIVVQAIQKGDLREPARLMGFVRTIVRRQVAGQIDRIVQDRKETVAIEAGPVLTDSSLTPEQKVITDEKLQLMMRVLNDMSARDREVLTRFYLKEQPQEQICRDMKLTDTQYRLLKSRAKARFGDLGRRMLNR